MADELAKVLTIPDSVTQKMDDVIEKISEIESASNKMADTVNTAWKSLANGEIDNYLKKLQDVANATSSNKISIDATDITKAASEAERWATAMAEVATQASNYAASKTATFAVQQEWNEALKALKEYEDARLRAEEQGTTVSPKAQASHDAILKRLEELRNAYPDLARIKDAAWDATAEKMYIKHLDRVEKKNQQIEDKEERQAHSRALRAKQIEAANTRILILAEKLSREEGKSQHYAGLIAELQRLQEEYKKLGNSKEEAERRGQLENEMEQVRASIQSADGAMRRLSNTTRGLFNYSEQLGRAFSLLFSVSAIKNYIRQIQEVTAEFELQRVALGSLLQSQDKANELFGQITNLAVRSPFTIKELNTYTKQLAAYNIQYENLFDTTKMLADVSAGLGVDIGRLILAFGQVKAATVLRGTEVRQFTEAGFGILGELAKYYTELEGRLVSVGDVQDRITKKMVRFADVEEIFKRVTSAGGMFYNMQEKLAQTLAGRWSNLTDRIELMMNEIGQSNMAIFNALIGVASTLADNWELVATALQFAVPMFAQFMVSTKLAGTAVKGFDKWLQLGRISIKKFGVALKTSLGPISAVMLAIEGLISVISYYNKRQEQAIKRAENFNRSISTIERAKDAFQEIDKAEKSANETDEQFAKRRYEDKKSSLQSFRTELGNLGYDISNLPDIKLLDEKQVEEEFVLLQERARIWAMFGRQMQEIIGGQATTAEGWFNIFGDNLKSDAEQLNDSYNLLQDAITLNVENIKNALTTLKQDIGEDEVNKLIDGLTQKPNEDLQTYLQRLSLTLRSMWGVDKRGRKIIELIGLDDANAKYLLKNITTAENAINSFQSKIIEFDRETKKARGKFVDEFYGGSEDELKRRAEENPIIFKAQLDTATTDAQITDYAKQRFTLGFVADIKLDEDKTPKTEWWKEYLPKLEKLGVDEKTLKSYASLNAYVEALSGQMTTAKTSNEELSKAIAKKDGDYAKANAKLIADNDTQIAKLNAIANALGVNLDLTKQEKKDAKTRNDYLKESVSLIEKMGKEYDDALDSMGKTAAKTDISTRYSSLLSDLADKAGMDGTAFVANLSFDTSGIISALQKVAEAAAKAGATEAEQAAREAIAEIQGNEVEFKVKANIEGFEKGLDQVLAQYQLGKELSKLGLGKELTESLFNFKSIDLNEVKSYLNRFKILHTDANGDMGEDYRKAYEKALKEVTDLENKELQERLKSYHKYLKQSMSDAVAIKLEEARQLDEINKMEIDAATKAQLREGVKRETSEKYDKAKWKEFQDSDMYIQMFEDLEYASTKSLETMKAKLIELKESLKNLTPEQLKEIARIYKQIDEELMKRNPFKSLAEAKREIDKMEETGRTPDVLNAEIEAGNARLSQLNWEIEQLSKTLELKRQNNTLTEQERKEYEWLIASKRKDKTDEETKISSVQDELEKYKFLIMAYQSGIEKTKEWEQIIGDLMSSSRALFEALGGEADSIGGIFLDLGMNMVNMVFQAIQFSMQLKIMKKQAELLKIEMNAAMGPIGWIAMALSAVASIATAVFQAHDKSRERQIERELDLIDELQRSYEKLEEAIDSAYSSSTYDQARDDAIANLEAQNKALERAQAAEQDKKKTDQDRINEWEQQKLDNLEKIAELERQAIEAYGGFGSNDNIKSAAEDFVSAWMDAFNETGKGLDALSDKMDEWLNNAIQKQLLMRLSEQYITPLLLQFDQMFEETSDMGRNMSKAELEAWKKIYEKNSKEFDEKAKAYLDALGIKPTGAESELSGLQRGIEGVTETTAQALEALLNSMRYYVSDSNNLLRQFYMSFISADETMNPMLYELKQHTTLLNAIHSLLNSTTKTTNNNGRVLKVLMV